MAILKIIEEPDPILRRKSDPVLEFNHELRSFLDDMLDTMYHANGAGLAAIQVGVPKRIFISNTDEGNDPIFFINPEITYYSENKIALNEGCLSFPGGRLTIERPEVVTVRFQDVDGKFRDITAYEWLSRAIQHENDHLNGVLLIDHISKLKQDMFLKKVRKNQQTK